MYICKLKSQPFGKNLNFPKGIFDAKLLKRVSTNILFVMMSRKKREMFIFWGLFFFLVTFLLDDRLCLTDVCF